MKKIFSFSLLMLRKQMGGVYYIFPRLLWSQHAGGCQGVGCGEGRCKLLFFPWRHVDEKQQNEKYRRNIKWVCFTLSCCVSVDVCKISKFVKHRDCDLFIEDLLLLVWGGKILPRKGDFTLCVDGDVEEERCLVTPHVLFIVTGVVYCYWCCLLWLRCLLLLVRTLPVVVACSCSQCLGVGYTSGYSWVAISDGLVYLRIFFVYYWLG